MRLLLVTDTFPPLNNSGAVQLWDLALGFKEAGHQLSVLVPSTQITSPWLIEQVSGIEIVRVKTPKLKDVNYFRRGLGELYMIFAMMRCMKHCALAKVSWDGIIWYSPSIFFGPLVHYIKKKHDCKTYLITRDIFPSWALDMGLMKRDLFYFMLQKIADYQYAAADTIGIQTAGNERYFLDWKKQKNRQLEVLNNWITRVPNLGCSIDLSQTSLVGRLIFVYAGNMGVAQNVHIFLELALLMRERDEVGFLFVGRGSELEALKNTAVARGLKNVLFCDEVVFHEIPGLFAQCHIGLIALDQRHQSHNIPGKFLTYLNAGLPVLAQVNLNNDLVKVIEEYGVGQVNSSYSEYALLEKADLLIDQLRSDKGISDRCKKLSFDLFSTQSAVNQITIALAK